MDARRKNYRAWDPQQNGHDAISPRDALPEDDLVFFLIDLIPQLDLTPFHQFYAQELRGQPPFDVTMMVILLVVGIGQRGHHFCGPVGTTSVVAARIVRGRWG